MSKFIISTFTVVDKFNYSIEELKRFIRDDCVDRQYPYEWEDDFTIEIIKSANQESGGTTYDVFIRGRFRV